MCVCVGGGGGMNVRSLKQFFCYYNKFISDILSETFFTQTFIIITYHQTRRAAKNLGKFKEFPICLSHQLLKAAISEC